MHRKKSSASALVAGVLLLAPVVTSAQGVMSVRGVRAATGTPPMNSCVRLKYMPSPMVESPEGFEVIKMQREIAATRDLLMQRSDTLNPALKQVMIVKNGVDSIVRVFAGGAEVGPSRFMIRTVPGHESEAARPSMAERRLIESMIREIQPRFDDAVRGGTLTIDVRSTALGYLGVSTSTSTYPSVLGPSRPFGYCDYPRVETVDPGSPAEKVGLSAGDTLLAYNNRDLLQYDVNYESLLVPGRVLHIKYRRDGQVREVSPTVARREPEVSHFQFARTPCQDPTMRAQCEGPQSVTVTLSDLPAGQTPQGGAMVAARARAVPSILYPTTPREAYFGGAKLRVMTEMFARNVNVSSGMLVLEVAEGSVAEKAGLREGDVIVSANGTAVRDANSLSNALAPRIAERVATLVLTNSTGSRTVTLRW